MEKGKNASVNWKFFNIYFFIIILETLERKKYLSIHAPNWGWCMEQKANIQNICAISRSNDKRIMRELWSWIMFKRMQKVKISRKSWAKLDKNKLRWKFRAEKFKFIELVKNSFRKFLDRAKRFKNSLDQLKNVFN